MQCFQLDNVWKMRQEGKTNRQGSWELKVLDWPKCSFWFFSYILWKNLNKFTGQANIKDDCNASGAEDNICINIEGGEIFFPHQNTELAHPSK